jgi:DNA replication protein DnaC
MNMFGRVTEFTGCLFLSFPGRQDIPLSKEGAELMFQVLAERHERGSVIITTNLGFGDWTQVFGDANLTAALLDRLTHKAHIIEFIWDS